MNLPDAVQPLAESAQTERTWNFRDDNQQHFVGTIPPDQKVITLTLNWKPDAGSAPRLVGKYKLHLPKLEQKDYIRISDRGYVLRFQRCGELIVIARNRNSKALVVGKK